MVGVAAMVEMVKARVGMRHLCELVSERDVAIVTFELQHDTPG